MADIKVGDEISVDWWPESVEAGSGTDVLDISSATFIVGTPEVGVTFVAPRSGRVAVCVSAGMIEQSAGNRVFVSFAVHVGTSTAGTQVQAPRAQNGVSTHGDTTAGGSGEMVKGNLTMVQGLTAGATHYAVMMHMVDAGTTNDVTDRRITVVPLP